MAKFLGVISNSYQRPSQDLDLEFTDLDSLSNFLFHETQNLLYEFQRNSEFIAEQEILLSGNLNKITEIFHAHHLLYTKTFTMEQESDRIEYCLCNMEKLINCIESIPKNSFACKCTINQERSSILNKLLSLSEDLIRIEDQVEQVKNQDICISTYEPCELANKLLQFLDYHTRILEKIEQKVDKVADDIQQVERIFAKAYNKIIRTCYKPRNVNVWHC